MEFFLNNKPYLMGIEVYARIQQGHEIAVMKPVELEVAEPGSLTPPAFVMENQAAQSFMDQLWNCGLRPSEGTGSAGSLKATENHLADMRKIAFKKLNIGEE